MPHKVNPIRFENSEANVEVLGEACQSVMRRAGLDQPYERLKELTRGTEVTVDYLDLE